MAIWKEQTLPKNDSATIPRSGNGQLEDPPLPSSVNSNPGSLYRSNASAMSDSLIAANLTIEGKIQGAGHIRMAGNFKGDINVDGNLTIEPGAKVIGSVRAQSVVIGGELEGNVESASHVELLETGVVNGDLQAGSLVVARGSRMRGQASFGWTDNAAATLRPSASSTASTPVAKMEVLSSA